VYMLYMRKGGLWKIAKANRGGGGCPHRLPPPLKSASDYAKT